MTSTKIETTTMTALDYTHAAHKQLAHGNEREAAGLLWKAAEAIFLALAHKRGIEHNGDLIEIAKTLDANGAVTKRYHRGSFGGASLLRAHAEFEALEKWELMDAYEATLDFVLEVNIPEALNGKR